MHGIRKAAPDWFAEFEDNSLETATSDELLAMLGSAPNAFAKGMLFGALMMRLEHASATSVDF